jgi:hypothetical protein
MSGTTFSPEVGTAPHHSVMIAVTTTWVRTLVTSNTYFREPLTLPKDEIDLNTSLMRNRKKKPPNIPKPCRVRQSRSRSALVNLGFQYHPRFTQDISVAVINTLPAQLHAS